MTFYRIKAFGFSWRFCTSSLAHSSAYFRTNFFRTTFTQKKFYPQLFRTGSHFSDLLVSYLRTRHSKLAHQTTNERTSEWMNKWRTKTTSNWMLEGRGRRCKNAQNMWYTHAQKNTFYSHRNVLQQHITTIKSPKQFIKQNNNSMRKGGTRDRNNSRRT